MGQLKRKQREESGEEQSEEQSQEETIGEKLKLIKWKKVKERKKRKQKTEDEEESDEDDEATTEEEEEEVRRKKKKEDKKKKTGKEKRRNREESEDEEESDEEEVRAKKKKKMDKRNTKKESRKKKEETDEEEDTKDDEEEKVPMITGKRKRYVKEGYVQYRCTMIAFLKTIAENKNKLTEGTLELLQKTPFATLIDAFHGGSIKEKDAKKSDDLITLLLQAYDSDTDLFVFGNRKFRMSTSDISMILGVPGSGLSVPKTKDGAYSSEFVTKYFDKNQRINKAAAEKALKKALAETPETGEEKKKRDRNVAVLVLLNLFIKLLFPNSGGTISWDYVRVCEEVESLGKYSWAKEVGYFLKKSIKRKAKESQNMAGCVILVMYWFCHKTGVVPPIAGRETEKHGIRKWQLKTLIEKKEDFNTMGKLKKIFDKVKEDAEEDDSESNTDTESKEKKNDGQEENVENRTSGNMEMDTAWNDQQRKELERNLQKKEEELRVLEIEKKGLEEKISKLEKEVERGEKKADHINAEHRDVSEETDENRNSEKMETEIGKNELQRKLEGKEEELTALKKVVEEKEKEIDRINEEMGDVLLENAVLKIERDSLNSRVKKLEMVVMALTDKYESPIARPGDNNESTPPPPPPSFPPPKSKAPQDKPTDSKHSKNTKSQGGIQGTQSQPAYSTASATEMTSAEPHSTDRGHQSPLECLAQVAAQVHSPTSPEVKLRMTEDACTPNTAWVNALFVFPPPGVFQTPPPRKVCLEDMQAEPHKYQIIISPEVQPVFDIDPVNCIPPTEQMTIAEFIKPIFEDISGKDSESIGLYYYVVRTKRKERVQNKHPIFWWDEVKEQRQRAKMTRITALKKKKGQTAEQQPEEEVIHDLTINVDDEEQTEKNEIEVIDWQKLQLYKLLDIPTKSKLEKYWNKAEQRVLFWEGKEAGSEITRADVKMFISDQSIANNWIDCYGEVLKDELQNESSQGLGRSAFMHSMCWFSTIHLTVRNLHQYLCEPLFQNMGKCSMLFFPITHNEEFHHTLLVFDKDIPQWLHFDSMKPRRAGTGQCFKSIKKLVEMVELWMRAVKDQADDMLQQGCRMQFDKSQSTHTKLKMVESILSDDEIRTIRWIKENYDGGRIPLNHARICPQQDEGSLDCGPFVMYYMDRMSKEEKMPNKVTKDQMMKFKAQVFKKFAEHSQSWNSAN
ncbi:hypothetical protein ABKV19_002966 [Rosa sericea]